MVTDQMLAIGVVGSPHDVIHASNRWSPPGRST